MPQKRHTISTKVDGSFDKTTSFKLYKNTLSVLCLQIYVSFNKRNKRKTWVAFSPGYSFGLPVCFGPPLWFHRGQPRTFCQSIFKFKQEEAQKRRLLYYGYATNAHTQATYPRLCADSVPVSHLPLYRCGVSMISSILHGHYVCTSYLCLRWCRRLYLTHAKTTIYHLQMPSIEFASPAQKYKLTLVLYAK